MHHRPLAELRCVFSLVLCSRHVLPSLNTLEPKKNWHAREDITHRADHDVDHDLDHPDHLDDIFALLRCCERAVSHRSYPANMCARRAVSYIHSPPGKHYLQQIILQITDISAPKDLDHELEICLICTRCCRRVHTSYRPLPTNLVQIAHIILQITDISTPNDLHHELGICLICARRMLR